MDQEKDIKQEIRDYVLSTRVHMYDRIKFITPGEMIRRYGHDMSDVEREIILTNEDIMYPVNE